VLLRYPRLYVGDLILPAEVEKRVTGIVALIQGDQILRHRSINQAYSAVVSDMQLFSQLADRDAFAVRKTLNGKQGLVRARGEPGVLGGLFAEMQRLPQLIANCRKHLVLGFAGPSGWASFRTGLHKEI
jgi:hypothetical protein